MQMLKAESLLLTGQEVRAALGSHVRLDGPKHGASSPAAGDLIKGAAADSAFRQFSGSVEAGDSLRPVSVSTMALVFDSRAKAAHTFGQVAAAAHLRAQLDGSDVAVETVTAPSGLVSYWGFVHKEEAIVVLTLDTLDPQRLSIGDLRSLATATARRLEAATARP